MKKSSRNNMSYVEHYAASHFSKPLSVNASFIPSVSHIDMLLSNMNSQNDQHRSIFVAS